VRRRAFITLLGGAAAAWPLAVRAEQMQMRRIGVLMPSAADDPVGQIRLGAFLQGLQPLGWAVGSNVQIDIRWTAGDARSQPQVRGRTGRTRAACDLGRRRLDRRAIAAGRTAMPRSKRKARI
jgi:hypothetical protein